MDGWWCNWINKVMDGSLHGWKDELINLCMYG